MKEFKVNNFITLKLEKGKTNIYINGQYFKQCLFLLLNIPVDKVSSFNDIESIDEASTKLSRKMENNHNIIKPEVEFMGHCSNIQAWAENDYDTRLLHSNIAFPLLKRLSELRDPIAIKIYKEEIAKRFLSGNYNVITYLHNEGYLDLQSSLHHSEIWNH